MKSLMSNNEPEKEQYVISSPQGVVHSGHVGIGPNGLQMNGMNVPPELRLLIEKTDSKLKEMGTNGLSQKETEFLLKKLLRNPPKPGTLNNHQAYKEPNQNQEINFKTPPTLPVKPSPTLPTKPSPELPRKPSNVKNNISELKKSNIPKNTSNVSQLYKLNQLLEQKDKKINELEQTIKTIQNDSSKPSKETLLIKEENSSLSKKNKELETQLIDLKKNISVQNNQKNLSIDFNKQFEDRIKTFQESMKKDLDLLKVKLSEVELERDKISDKNAILEVELTKFKTSKNPLPSKETNQIEILTNEINELKNKIKSIERDRDNLSNTKRSLQTQVDYFSSQTLLQNELVSSKEKEISQKYENQIKDLTEKHKNIVSSFETKLESDSFEITKLKQSLKDSENALNYVKISISNDSGEMEKFRKMMQEQLDNSRLEIATHISTKNIMQKQIDSMNEKIQNLDLKLKISSNEKIEMDKNNVKLTNRISELEKNLKSRTESDQNEIDSLKKELDESQNQIGSLKSSNLQLKNEISSFENKSLDKELENKLNISIAESKQVQSRLANANAAKEKFEKRIEELETKVNQLNLELNSKQLAQEHDSSLILEINGLKNQIDETNGEIIKITNSKNELETKNKLLKTNLEDVLLKNSSIQSELKETKSELNLIRSQIQIMEMENNSETSETSTNDIPMAPTPPPVEPNYSNLKKNDYNTTNKDLLESIRKPDIVLKKSTITTVSDVSDNDDLLNILARRIIDRRDKMKDGVTEQELDDDDDW